MAVIIIKANSNNPVMILIEFIGNPVPPVIGFGYLVSPLVYCRLDA
jgi:hypothetical protein